MSPCEGQRATLWSWVFFFYLYMGSRDQTVISPSHQSLLDGSSFQFIHLKMPRRANRWQAPHLRDKLLVLGIGELLCQVSTGISPTCPLFIWKDSCMLTEKYSEELIKHFWSTFLSYKCHWTGTMSSGTYCHDLGRWHGIACFCTLVAFGTRPPMYVHVYLLSSPGPASSSGYAGLPVNPLFPRLTSVGLAALAGHLCHQGWGWWESFCWQGVCTCYALSGSYFPCITARV